MIQNNVYYAVESNASIQKITIMNAVYVLYILIQFFCGS